jgi:large subunit ribosomal protein L17
MRHRRQGRKLGRNPKHQRALLRSLASELILTERDPSHELFQAFPNAPEPPKPPKVRGRIITTVAKAKEVRPLVERCVTIAKKAQASLDEADRLAPTAERNSQEWKSWRSSPKYAEWNQAIAPALAARRRLIQLLGSREAAQILIDEIAPRFIDRPGGYTRVVKLATPRLGDAGPRAILEFVGQNDRTAKKSQRPTFDAPEEPTDQEAPAAAEPATAE